MQQLVDFLIRIDSDTHRLMHDDKKRSLTCGTTVHVRLGPLYGAAGRRGAERLSLRACETCCSASRTEFFRRLGYCDK